MLDSEKYQANIGYNPLMSLESIQIYVYINMCVYIYIPLDTPHIRPYKPYINANPGSLDKRHGMIDKKGPVLDYSGKRHS